MQWHEVRCCGMGLGQGAVGWHEVVWVGVAGWLAGLGGWVAMCADGRGCRDVWVRGWMDEWIGGWVAGWVVG